MQEISAQHLHASSFCTCSKVRICTVQQSLFGQESSTDSEICLTYWSAWILVISKIKINQSHYRPGQTHSVPGSWKSQISRQSALEGGKVVSPTHRPPLSPKELFLVLISITGWVNHKAIVWPEGLCQRKIPVTPPGIEPAIFRLVAQCLSQLRHFVSRFL
jgi:hypothetical protein